MTHIYPRERTNLLGVLDEKKENPRQRLSVCAFETKMNTGEMKEPRHGSKSRNAFKSKRRQTQSSIEPEELVIYSYYSQ